MSPLDRPVFLLAALGLLAAPLAAQTRTDLQPLPDVPPPVMAPLGESLEPQVTIKKRQGSTIEEHRVNGKLFKIIVTPENAPPYVLIDSRGDGVFTRVESPGTPQISVPMWVIGTF